MSPPAFLRRLRGFRLVEIGALTIVLVLALGVYLVKARAGRETGDITSVEDQIADEQRSVRLLEAEVSHLEQPERLARLSETIGLEPTSVKHEAEIEQLPDLARQAALTAPAAPEAAKPAAPAQSGALR